MILVSVSQYTRTDLCVTGARYQEYDGTYKWLTTITDPLKGGVWKHSNLSFYIYPYTESDCWYDSDCSDKWLFSSYYPSSYSHLKCTHAQGTSAISVTMNS